MNETVHVVWHPHAGAARRGVVVWFTGLSGSGKSTIAGLVAERLAAAGVPRTILDGDNLRHGLNAPPAALRAEYGDAHAERFGLGFGEADRRENLRRTGEVATILCDAGLVVLASLVSPYRVDRDAIRRRVTARGGPADFLEAFVDAPLAVCEDRDPKGLYKKARAGEIKNFTGLDAPYEAPEAPELHLVNDGTRPADALAEAVVERLRRDGRMS